MKPLRKIYTGVGSRFIPDEVEHRMKTIAENAAKEGWTLRSGGAGGADTAFELGCDIGKGNKEIYLPWKGFSGSRSELHHIDRKAFQIAQLIHPAWDKLSFGGKKLHARNVYQVLGLDLKTRSDVVICWTKNGQSVGGTRTAIELAKLYEVPVINLALVEGIDIWKW